MPKNYGKHKTFLPFPDVQHESQKCCLITTTRLAGRFNKIFLMLLHNINDCLWFHRNYSSLQKSRIYAIQAIPAKSVHLLPFDVSMQVSFAPDQCGLWVEALRSGITSTPDRGSAQIEISGQALRQSTS
jgi:hypothetical protein